MNISRSNDGMIAGVASGIARSLNVDATLVRLAFVLFTVFGGSGVLLYLVLWAVIPRETGGSVAEEGFRKAKSWYDDRNSPKPPTY